MKIVAVMKNWLGDLLFQMPALDLIQKKYPGASITCVAPERCREILEAHPAVSDFLSFDEKGAHRSWASRVRFVLELRRRGPWDQGYLFHRSRSRAVLLALAGVKERIGYGKGRKCFLTRAVEEPAQPAHQLDYFFAMMQGAGFDLPGEREYRFYYQAKDEQAAREVLGGHGIAKNAKYICFHLGANWEPKRWPVRHFAALAGKITERWGLPVVVTGSAQDRPLFDAFTQALKTSGGGRTQRTAPLIIDLVGKTSLRVSACVYEHAACLVTGDSGPMHIASGVGAPVIALFGPTDPKLTGPRGRGESLVLQYVPPGYTVPFFGKDLPEAGWLSQITPGEVLDAVERILEKS